LTEGLDELSEEDQDLMARMHVTVPPKKAGRLSLQRFTIRPNDDAGHSHYGKRMAEPGEYSKLQELIPGHPHGGVVWMSDTPAELVDHLEVARLIARPTTKRVLINGLGLGCIAKLAASFDHVERIDVVELDPRVVKIVGRWFDVNYGSRVRVVQADAYKVEWAKDMHWDVVWHDIWPHIDEDNLPEMHRLHDKYAGRSDWQGYWVVELCMMMHDVNRELFRRVEEQDGRLPQLGDELWESYQEYLELEHHYAWFVEQGYHAAPRDGHPTPLDQLDENWEEKRPKAIWRVLP